MQVNCMCMKCILYILYEIQFYLMSIGSPGAKVMIRMSRDIMTSYNIHASTNIKMKNAMQTVGSNDGIDQETLYSLPKSG